MYVEGPWGFVLNFKGLALVYYAKKPPSIEICLICSFAKLKHQNASDFSNISPPYAGNHACFDQFLHMDNG